MFCFANVLRTTAIFSCGCDTTKRQLSGQPLILGEGFLHMRLYDDKRSFSMHLSSSLELQCHARSLHEWCKWQVTLTKETYFVLVTQSNAFIKRVKLNSGGTPNELNQESQHCESNRFYKYRLFALICTMIWKAMHPKRAQREPRSLPRGPKEPPRHYQKHIKSLTAFSSENGPPKLPQTLPKLF